MTKVWMCPCVRCMVRHVVMAYARRHRAAYASIAGRLLALRSHAADGRRATGVALSAELVLLRRRSRNLSIERRELQCHSKMISCRSEC